MIKILWKLYGKEWTTTATELSGAELSKGLGGRVPQPSFDIESNRIDGEIHSKGQRVGSFKVVYG